MSKHVVPAFAVVAVVAAACLCLTSCIFDQCDEYACELVKRPVAGAEIRAGIAGVVASRTDHGHNGCFECGFASTQLTVWRTEAVVEREEHVAAVRATASFLTLDAQKRYQRALEPGHYVVCAARSRTYSCAAITVMSNRVVSVNVQLVYGPPRLVVFEPGTTRARTTGIFNASDPTFDARAPAHTLDAAVEKTP